MAKNSLPTDYFHLLHLTSNYALIILTHPRKGIQEHPVATPRSTQGSSHSMKSGGGGGSVQGASVSNLSVASSRQMMYCTPLVGSENASRASTPANGYVSVAAPDEEFMMSDVIK